MSSIQVDLAECVETKIVTTTTTTKRSYPPLFVRQKPLTTLNAIEYPLATRDTPPEFANFTFKLDGSVEVEGNDTVTQVCEHKVSSVSDAGPPRHSNSRHTSQQSHSHSRFSGSSVTNDDSYQGQRGPDFDIDATARFKGKRHNKRLAQGLAAKSQPRRLQLGGEQLHAQSRKGDSYRKQGLGMHLQDNSEFPATPDLSELESANENGRQFGSYFEDSYTPKSGRSQDDSFEEMNTGHDAVIQEHLSAVATPPVAESDLERVDDTNEALSYATVHRPTVNTAVAQNASLPSPGLSPTFHGGDFDEQDMEERNDEYGSLTQSGDSQETMESDDSPSYAKQTYMENYRPISRPSSPHSTIGVPSVLGARAMIETFDAMPNEMKTFMMYQLLRRCSKKTLHTIAGVVNPALKCDFIDRLPAELSFHILSYLNHKDLCRAAQVSRQWRNVIDSNEKGWKDLFDRDGFILPIGELERAINQGWGWQDPYGPEGFEADLSVPKPLPSTDMDLSLILKSETTRKPLRSGTKRKRTSHGSGSDRSRRKTGSYELTDPAQRLNGAKFDRSEGPLTAANAAALAVPDPNVGLPSLRKLHLFKSLYRRHHMLRLNWTSRTVEPRHFAFPAHPSHVITCLQFDDDKILTGSDDTLIHVYDTRTGKLRKKLEGHEGGVWALQYEGNVLVSGSTDRSVRVWDIEKGLCTQVFHGHTSTVRCLQILMPQATGKTHNGHPEMLPAKPLIITGSRDSQLRVWKLPEQGSKRFNQNPPGNDADCPYFVRTLSGHSHSVRAIAAHQDTLVSGSYDNTVRVWKISTGETLHRLQGHSMKVYSVVLDTKRNRCISGSMDTYVKIWCLETGACLYTLEGHTSLVGLLDLRDERLVSAAADSSLRIWDPENGQCKSTLTAHTGAITCFQHDGQKVISGSDRTLKMWDVKTGECVRDLLTDLSGVWQVKFDERRCVAAVQRDSRTFVEVSWLFSRSRCSILTVCRSLTLALHETASKLLSAAIETWSSLISTLRISKTTELKNSLIKHLGSNEYP